MNNCLIRITIYLFIATSLTSCSILGIHFKVHNPKHDGKYPAFSEESVKLGELTPLRDCFDVKFYGLDLELNPKEKSVDGWVEIMAEAQNDIDSFQIDLDKTLAIQEIHIGSRDGKKLNFSRKYRAVVVVLSDKINKGDLFTIHVKYSGKPVVARKPPWAGGMVWKKDKEKNYWAGVACESEGASIWFPCKDHNSDEPDSASMRFTIQEKNLMVVSNGILTNVEETPTGKSFTWKVHNPINSYNITFYLGNFEKIADTYTDINGKILNIRHYVLKPNLEKATEHFKQVKKYLAGYEKLYGEYPWYDDGFKLVESPYSGMEHQSAIAYGNGFKNDLYKKDDYIMLHETGHEWFGNAVSVSDFADIWLQEGVTTYGEALYLENQYDAATSGIHLLFYRWTIKNERPVVGPKGRHYFDYHDGDVYVKGAWTLHTLRNQINNDSIFMKVIRTFYSENKYKTTSTDKFIKTVNEVTGKNYNWLFDQYLYKSKAPIFEYYIAKDGFLYYRWTETAEDFNRLKVPFVIENDVNKYDVFPSNKVQRYKLPEGTSFTAELKVDNSKALFGYKKNKGLVKLFNE